MASTYEGTGSVSFPRSESAFNPIDKGKLSKTETEIITARRRIRDNQTLQAFRSTNGMLSDQLTSPRLAQYIIIILNSEMSKQVVEL